MDTDDDTSLTRLPSFTCNSGNMQNVKRNSHTCSDRRKAYTTTFNNAMHDTEINNKQKNVKNDTKYRTTDHSDKI